MTTQRAPEPSAALKREVDERERVAHALQSALGRLQKQMRVVGELSRAEEMLAGDVEGLAHKVTELAAGAVGCERVNVWLFDADEAVLRCIDCWEATPRRHSSGMVLEERQYANEFHALKASEHVAADDPLTDPRTAGYVESYLRPLGITAMLDTVIQISGKHLGLLCFEHVGTQHRWRRDEISFAAQLADKLGLALLSRMRRRAEDELRASENRFRTIFDTVSDAVFVHDIRSGTFLDVNTRVTELFGYERDELVGRGAGTISVGTPPFSEEDARARLDAAGAGRPSTFEWHFEAKCGRRFWGEVSLSRGLFGAQEVVLATVRDVTERRRRSERLQAAAAELNEAQHLARLGSWSFDPRTGAVTWSDELYRILGRDPSLPAPNVDQQATLFEPHAYAAMVAAVRKCVQDGTPYALDLAYVAEDGREGWLLARGEVERGEDGAVERVRGTVLDITERKRAENQLRQVQEALAEAQAVAHVGSWQLDLRTAELTWSDEGFRIFGDDPATSPASFDLLVRRIHPDDRALLAAAFQRSLEDRAPYELEHRIVRADGTVRVVHVRGRTAYAADGTPLRTIGTIQDFTRWKETEAALIRERDFSTALVDSLPGLFVLLDERGRLLRWNENVSRMTGLPDERLDRIDGASLVAESDRDAARAKVLDALRRGAGDVELAIGAKDDVRAIQWSGRRITSEGRAFLVAVGSDVTERKRAEAQIRSMARQDVLTGLANRAVFVEALETCIAHTRRSDRTFAVLYLDLDHFKDVNDTLGHPVGDLLLQSIAERLRAVVRDADTVARFGGDEFAIIATDVRDPADAAVLADKILKAIAEPFPIQGNDIRTATSVGIAIHGPESQDAEELLSHADVALYRAKSEGRGTYRFFTESMDDEVRARVTLGAELRTALATEQFFLVYQPQVDVDTGRIVGLEALVRWRHPWRGVVLPCEFVPVAEQSGLIVPLGSWVLHEACRQTKEWSDAGHAPPLIAVNVSGLQFKTADELERVIASTLAETSVPPELLELEVTESVVMDASHEVLARLREKGLRIAIDDFGMGYSSLGYLSRFPVDRIKIAQDFVLELDQRTGNAAIVKAAIGLAHELGLDVVVEGVETEEQLRVVRSWGARKVQGFYYARPLLAADAAALLRAGRIERARGSGWLKAALSLPPPLH